MDAGGEYENGRYKQDHYRGGHPTWNMMPQNQIKEQNNALVMNKKIMSILAERDAAIKERNEAVAEKREALAARDEALQQRDKALLERDNALMERDSALAALQYRDGPINFALGSAQRALKRTFHCDEVSEAINAGEMHIPDAFPLATIAPDSVKPRQVRRTKENKATSSKTSRKVKKVSEDLNRQVASAGKKSRTEWNSQELGLNLVTFDETTMPVPVCTCTGTAHQCYKWGSGGWQSSCCTTTLSQYPLPQLPNKRHARVGGRKMSGSVFTRLLTRLASEGHDLSVPLDLRNYWARHGTNRYITIK